MLSALVAAASLASAGAGLLGLQLNVSAHGGVDELFALAKETREMGCSLLAHSVKWSDIERSPGKIDTADLKRDFDWRGKMGFVSYLTIQTIDTNQRTLPSDLMREAWDSPVMLRRETAMLHAVAKALPKSIGAVMLGNEVDGYLIAHRNEIAPYLSFLKSGRTVLRADVPGLPVGVTTMFLNLKSEKDLISQLQAPMDLVSMTYYPLEGMARPRPPREVMSDFEEMLRFSGKRLLFLQEAGVPASPLVGSSEDLQAEFVDRLFDAMAKYRARLAGVCYFLAIDFSDSLLDQLVGYYGVQGDRFRAFLGSLGLKKQDGKPRKAWEVFKKRASEYTADHQF
ncbi:MAG TPA: hypothetical protein VHE55_11945 [Fimbriimonadaceae bacterium]|nr:hypothetical protein [Fimbriimonadaceae bacterium]